MGKYVEAFQSRQSGLEGKNVGINFNGISPPFFYASVSLCMIVRNEEKNLVACLDSIGDFASEIIVTDTGSTDRTVEIARSYGAKVNHFTWLDDFAAARNISIKDATSEWIFWLDADDRISPHELNKLKEAVASESADGYMIRISSKEQDAQTMTEHLRLFRNHRGLVFERPLHETVLPMAVRCGLTIARTNIIIEHVGYEIDADGLRSKARRNLKIIQNCLHENPNDLHWHYHLGVCHSILGNYQQAIEAYKLVVACPPKSLNWDIDVYQAHISLISAYIKTECISGAEDALKRALSLFPRRHLAALAGMFYLMRDEPSLAVDFLEKARTFSQESDWLGHSWPPGQIEAELGHAYFLIGKYDLARDIYKARTINLNLNNKPAAAQTLTEAQELFLENKYDRAVQLLTPYSPRDPITLRFLAKVETRRQHWSRATRYLSQAMALDGPTPAELIQLAELTLRCGMKHSAERLCRIALQAKEGQTADAFNLLGLIAIQKRDIENAISYLIQALLEDFLHASAKQNLAQLADVLSISTAEMIKDQGLQLLHQDRAEQAVNVFMLLIQLEPKVAEWYKLLAATLQTLGQEEDALAIWRSAQQVAANS